MPHATTTSSPASQSKHGKASSSKQLQQVQRQYAAARSLYDQSALADSLDATLQGKLAERPTPITKVVSLGLGSFAERSRDQSRRFKQLAMFVALADHVRQLQDHSARIALFAQDPSFSKADEAFLRSLGVSVLKTTSASTLGEAEGVIDANALLFTPFLTIDAYKLLLEVSGESLLVGDDFNALKNKWEKNTGERREVEGLMRRRVAGLRRRVVAGEGFWEEEDRPFPMALYWRQGGSGEVPKAKL